MNYNKIVVIAPARSGSTFFRNLMDSHPKLNISGELFSLNRVLGLNAEGLKGSYEKMCQDAQKVKEISQIRFLNEYVFPDNRNIYGFKLLYRQYLHDSNLEAINWLKNKNDVKFIHLWRENLLARFVSNQLFIDKHNPSVKNFVNPKTKKVFIDPNVFIYDTNFHLETKNMINESFNQENIYNITYENIINDNGDLKKLFDWLELDYVQLNSITLKEDNRLLSDKIENINEIRKIESINQYLS